MVDQLNEVDEPQPPKFLGELEPTEVVIPEAVVRAAKRGNLVLFVGAGVSTESRLAYPTTLYEELKNALEWEKADDATFPRIMSAYEEKFGRRELISEVAQRLDYAESFPFISWAATRFHRELSTIAHVQTIITTNWDTAFEDYCQARPFVVDEDYAFYDLPGRKVFKIHGSIRNVSSLIATEEDYQRREEEFQTSAMGSSLKHFLATEVVVFVGFSLTDPDFQNVYAGLLKGLARSRPPAYIVEPFAAPLAGQFGLKVIEGDGTQFLHQLKHRLVQDDLLFEDSVLARVDALKYAVEDARRTLEMSDWRDSAPLFYSLSYLDGMIDACGRSLRRAASGDVMEKNHLAHIIRTYDRLLAKAVDLERWWDAAYIDGYRIVLYSFFMDDKDLRQIDLYQAFDSSDYPGVPSSEIPEEESDFPADAEEPRQLPARPEPQLIVDKFAASPTTARESIEKGFRSMVAGLPAGRMPRHTPFIDGLMDDDEPLPSL